MITKHVHNDWQVQRMKWTSLLITYHPHYSTTFNVISDILIFSYNKPKVFAFHFWPSIFSGWNFGTSVLFFSFGLSWNVLGFFFKSHWSVYHEMFTQGKQQLMFIKKKSKNKHIWKKTFWCQWWQLHVFIFILLVVLHCLYRTCLAEVAFIII